MKKCFHKEIKSKPFDPIKSDIFSLGLIILYLEQKNISDLNSFDLEPTMYKDMHINKSNASVFKPENDNSLTSSIINCLNNLTRKIANIIEPINNKVFHNLASSSLNIFYEYRPNIQKLKTKTLKLSPIELSKKNQNIEFGGQLNNICINNDVMKVTVKIDSAFIELLSYRKEVISNENFDNFRNKIALILESFDKMFSVACDAFFDSNINDKICINDAILSAFKFLLIYFKDPQIVENFYEKVKSLTKTKTKTKKNDISIQFSSLIDYILNYDENLQNYFVTGLFVFKEYDIEYFFRIRSPYEQIIFKFESEAILVEEFKAMLSSDIIQEVFKSAHNKIFDFGAFESRVLKRIFLLETQESLVGLTSYDLRIYIKSFNFEKTFPVN